MARQSSPPGGGGELRSGSAADDQVMRGPEDRAWRCRRLVPFRPPRSRSAGQGAVAAANGFDAKAASRATGGMVAARAVHVGEIERDSASAGEHPPASLWWDESRPGRVEGAVRWLAAGETFRVLRGGSVHERLSGAAKQSMTMRVGQPTADAICRCGRLRCVDRNQSIAAEWRKRRGGATPGEPTPISPRRVGARWGQAGATSAVETVTVRSGLVDHRQQRTDGRWGSTGDPAGSSAHLVRLRADTRPQDAWCRAARACTASPTRS